MVVVFVVVDLGWFADVAFHGWDMAARRYSG
jgi:hypothetical protein